MPQQVYFLIGIIIGFGLLALGLTISIKKHDAKMATMKKKKGRNKYMQPYKKPGR